MSLILVHVKNVHVVININLIRISILRKFFFLIVVFQQQRNLECSFYVLYSLYILILRKC